MKIALWQSRKTRLQQLMLPSSQCIGKDIRGSSWLFTRRAPDVISEASSLRWPEIAMICLLRWTSAWSRRSETVMISMNFRSYASLVLSFIIPVLFCFFFFGTRNFIYCTSVSCVWSLLPYVSLQSKWAWKPSKVRLPVSFTLWGLSSLLTLY